MSRHLYALLVGINEYPKPISSLSGCVNDINAVEEYLKERIAQPDGYKPHIRKLLNQEATRKAIIDGFRQHLCQAGSEDIVLFYYSGHGSQAKTPKEFWHLEPDRLEETLVCYDSRAEGCWGLADKELAYLIAKVAEKNPHICIILDCCHSGNGTRDLLQETGVRRFCKDERERPRDSYIFSPKELESLSVNRGDAKDHLSGWKIPKGRHILLAACQDCETASDAVDGKQQGAFSYLLMETLRNNGKLTYRDLFKQANALVRSKVSAQSPQFEVTHPEDETRFFLDGAIAERKPYFTVQYTKDHGWVIDGGAVHGVKGSAKGETTLLTLFPLDCQDLHDPSQSVGEAKVTQVLPSLSKVKISGIENLTKERTFKAVVTSVPLPPLGVYFQGEEAGVNLARQALQSASFGKPSAYVREEQELAEAEFRLLCCNEQYLIVRPTDDRPLVEQIDGYTSENAEKAIQRLEHIARWNAIVKLHSPPTSSIKPDDVKMTFLSEEGEELSQSKEIRLEYKYSDSYGEWEQPAFNLKLTNTSKKTLYLTLVDLTDLFAVQALFSDTGSVRLQPEEEVVVLEEYGGIAPKVPDELWEQGITEFKDIMKLIVSTTEFDARLMTQEALDTPRLTKRDVSSPNQSTLDRLMNRVQSRDLEPRSKGRFDNWYTEEVVITTVRPLDAIKVFSKKPQELKTGVQLQPHPSLQANVRLTTAPQVSRDVGNKIVPPIFQDDPHVTQSFKFAVSRGTAPELSILELDNVENHTVVTPDAPLKLVVDTPLQDNEYVLPIGYDGEFFMPLGLGKTTQNGKTEIELERLPEPVSQGKRDLKGAIRICFQKVVREQLGLEFQYPLLAIAEVGDDQKVTDETDVAEVKKRVAQSERIVLYIHGIIGDTKSLVSSLQQTLKVEDNNRSIRELYDLVLTFDYENLNTPIEENARLLKKQLEAVGLGANHGKVLHIVAHSMGGLVSRWFIEQEGGNKVVQHLIMLGTPNAGSPWATVKEWATMVMAVGINSLSQTPLPVKALGSLSEAMMNTVEVALDQMQPNSQFIQALATSNDPGIPYSIIAGNTSISPAALQEDGEKATLLKRLMKKLFDKAVALPFLGEPNDIAVTVHSIKSLPDGWSVSPFIQEVACDHLTYFNHPEGLKALLTTLTQESKSHILPNLMVTQR
ncbi:MAG: caspase family protein [Coleofasciculus sp. B1-GNL1-01]|uniref:caspase family protein n=1 Tax=Coleofasciculus sp. B1-GNL1-01 TaxID=3068484 RepID=UPI0032F2B279